MTAAIPNATTPEISSVIVTAGPVGFVHLQLIDTRGIRFFYSMQETAAAKLEKELNQALARPSTPAA